MPEGIVPSPKKRRPGLRFEQPRGIPKNGEITDYLFFGRPDVLVKIISCFVP